MLKKNTHSLTLTNEYTPQHSHFCRIYRIVGITIHCMIPRAIERKSKWRDQLYTKSNKIQ